MRRLSSCLLLVLLVFVDCMSSVFAVDTTISGTACVIKITRRS